MKRTTLTKLKSGAAPFVLSLAMISSPSFAQAAAADEASAGEGQTIIVTGSRIARPNLESTSPVAVVTGAQTTENADITLDTFLNTLPQVNPAGTTSSNNPGNNGQANIDLRGLGNNRNLVLIDGRRPMSSGTDQTVDLNTIPQALIKRVEVVTGGAGATYGADAIAGVVNFILKDDFHGLQAEASYSNTLPETDAREYRLGAAVGLNFGDGRGNIAASFEYARRQGLIKSQRSFAAQATSTTSTPPTGRFNDAAKSSSTQNPGNALSQSAIDSLFLTKYGVPVGSAGAATQLGFNKDGTLFGGGTFNTPINLANFRYDPLGQDAAAANQNFSPDFYSYNFDAINLLVLPLERKSAFLTAHYEISDPITVYVQGGWTEYTSATALAPTPVGVTIVPTTSTKPTTSARSALLTPGKGCFTSSGAASECSVTGLLIPTTNPFIPADLKTLLASRTGNDNRYVGSGATEPFNIAYRFLPTGLRRQDFKNEVLQGLIGFKGNLNDKWRYDIYYSYGHTAIDQTANGNINVQKMQALLEAADGGASLCAGGFNPFGIQPLSDACVNYVRETGLVKSTFTQQVASGYVSGDLFELPAGAITIALGAEYRKFDYTVDPGALSGPIAGFNTQQPVDAGNNFLDFFGEALIPLVSDASWAKSLDLTIGYRHSRSDSVDRANSIDAPANNSSAYKAELNWLVNDNLRVRGGYQRAVRAPNISELFSAGGSFPQIFDPCTKSSSFLATSGAKGAALCTAQGVTVGTFVAIPGSQAPLGGAQNAFLKPEKADTFTAGAVVTSGRFSASLDYYNMKVSDVIRIPDANLFIAGCFNYVGNLNPTLDSSNDYCTSVIRSGGNISFLAAGASLGGDSNSNFIAINRGSLKTSGLDLQMDYSLPTDFAGPDSALSFNLMVNYLFDFKEEELPGVVIDYAGTAGYFGQGLSAGGGASHPKWRGTLNTSWKMGEVTPFVRLRYIDGMTNRLAKQFVGEATTGPGSVVYVDLGAQVEVGPMLLRLGLNNAFNRKPPSYSPNVQSGTDPSLYDVVGRRAYISTRLKF
jgi:iron complex outermembrane receptor protein